VSSATQQNVGRAAELPEMKADGIIDTIELNWPWLERVMRRTSLGLTSSCGAIVRVDRAVDVEVQAVEAEPLKQSARDGIEGSIRSIPFICARSAVRHSQDCCLK